MTSTADAVLQVADLRVEFRTDEGRVQAVRGVSYQLHRGEVLGIVGESGSGKSVMSLAVLGLLPGSARVSGSVRQQAVELLAPVSIPNPTQRVDSYPHELSGGMRQRVVIAIAMANHPPSGCRFRTRCPRFATQLTASQRHRCTTDIPLLTDHGHGHAVVCHWSSSASSELSVVSEGAGAPHAARARRQHEGG